jgi:DNA replication protein DnaC
MERTQIFDLMGELKLYGMKAAFDEIMATAVKRQHEPQRIVGDLLNAEINEKQARSIKYQLTIAKLPLAKDIADFQFDGTPINQTLVNDLAGGGFIAQQRNVVLVGGTGTGKTHLAIAIARSCIRSGARGRFYNVVDLVNRLETETRNGRQGRLAEHLTRMDFIVLDELGYLPFAQSGGQLLFHLVSRLYERASVIVTTNLARISHSVEAHRGANQRKFFCEKDFAMIRGMPRCRQSVAQNGLILEWWKVGLWKRPLMLDW